MILRLIFLATIVCFPSLGQTAPKIVGFSDATFSRAEGPFFGTPDATVHTIYGGISGDCETESPSSFCDSCIQDTPDPTKPCNSRRVHKNLRFGISITTEKRGKVRVTNDLDDAQVQLEFYANGAKNSEFIFEANTTVLVEVPWGQICSQVTGLDDQCDGSPENNVNIRIGIDEIPLNTTGDSTDGTGDDKLTGSEYVKLQIKMGKLPAGQTPLCIKGDAATRVGACNFIAYPGDKKIFLEEVYADSSFPSITGSKASAVAIRVFHTTKLPYPTINTPDYKDIPIKLNSTAVANSDGVKIVELIDTIVDGLENDVPHYFAIGVVDETSNVGLVTNMAGTPPATDNKDDKSLCYLGTDDDWPQNCHRAEPAEVIGLIKDEFDCFITTATYGSPFRPKVEDFRKFRNQFLKTHWLGKKVIEFYYDNSPPIAAWIRNNPGTKPYFRVILYPFWFVAKASLTWPLLTLSFFLSLILLPVTFIFRKRLPL